MNDSADLRVSDPTPDPTVAPAASETSPLLPVAARREAVNHRFVTEAARLCADLHATDVLVLDVRHLSAVADYILIASGTSDRQIRSLAQDVIELGDAAGLPCFGRDQDTAATWVALDFVDVVVHLFDPATRAYYDLEMLWGDAPPVDWQRV